MFGRSLLVRFPLEEGVSYLNHGAFGVVAHDVTRAQRAIADAIERQPARYLGESLMYGLLASRQAAADLIGAKVDDVVLVDNATTGANAVFQSLDLHAGDVVVDLNIGYPGVHNALARRAAQAGAEHRTRDVSLPLSSDNDVLSATRGVTGRILVVDQIASASAVVSPVADVCAASEAPVLVDGAHVPGHLDVDVPSIGADWWVGNLHKWAFAPRGTAVLWARPERQASLHPPTVSLGYGDGWPDTFGWPGTRDFSGWLAFPSSIEFAASLGGFDAIRAYGRELLEQAVGLVSDALDVEPVAPASMRAQMATFPLPWVTSAEQAGALSQALRRDGIEVPLFHALGQWWFRIAAQVYNDRSDYVRLVEALRSQRVASSSKVPASL